jgi:hypothetical protein
MISSRMPLDASFLAALGERERRDLAGRTDLSEEVERELALDPDWLVRARLAANPALRPGTQLVLARDADSSVSDALTANLSLDPEVQLVLAADPGSHFALARNPSLTSQAQLVLFANAVFTDLNRMSLAKNPSVAHAAQHILARDEFDYVREALASNPAVVADASFPPLFLSESEVGRALLAGARSAPGVDPEAFDALALDWQGTLSELTAVASELAPGPR